MKKVENRLQTLISIIQRRSGRIQYQMDRLVEAKKDDHGDFSYLMGKEETLLWIERQLTNILEKANNP